MSKRNIIVIGTSAGGIEALRELFGGLPQNFPASIFVVCHLSPQSLGVLPKIISRNGNLPAVNASDRDRIIPGRIYVAPPDHHLLLESGFVRLSQSPKENRVRPAIDPLFRSAADSYGPQVIAVILTGMLDDGTAGLWAIKERGGLAVVQDPADALFPSMPLSAITHVQIDYQISLADMPALLIRLISEPLEEEREAAMSDRLKIKIKIPQKNQPSAPLPEQLMRFQGLSVLRSRSFYA